MSQENRPSHETWWSNWGQPVAYIVLGIVCVVGAIVLALILVGAIF